MSNSLRYRERTAEVAEQMRKLRQSQPELLSAFGALGSAGTKDGALTKKRDASSSRRASLSPAAAMTASASICNR